jgi:large subunit ribosomal protein L15
MNLDDVHRGVEKRRKRKRIGRGPGSGFGKTAGKGHKGYYSRAGSSKRVGYEGGQMPLARRIAKRGFSNRRFQQQVAIVNVAALEKAFEDGASIRPETLVEKGLASKNSDCIKILGNGQLTKKLTVAAHAFSTSAEEKITAQGGTVEKISVL